MQVFRMLRRYLALIAVVGPAFAVPSAVSAQSFVYGIDVSVHQGAINWTNVKSAGIQFAYTKATEGVDFIDTRFVQNMTSAAAAGVYIGPYHYARPDSSSTNPLDPVNEANDFVDAIEPYYQIPGFTLRPVVDMEESDIAGTTNLKAFISDWLRDFGAVVEQRLGFKPIVYASTSYINSYFESNISAFPLWLANWNYTPPNVPPASADGIFNGWDFWQYTASGSVGGISPVDRDVYQGTLAQMLAEFRGVQPTGDFNQDGDVDGADLLTWQKWVGTSGTTATFARGDANGDRVINSDDLAVWSAGFGQTPPVVGASGVVPEPSTVVLAYSTIAAWTVARRRCRAA